MNEPRRIAGKPTIGIFPEAVVLPNGERATRIGCRVLATDAVMEQLVRSFIVDFE